MHDAVAALPKSDFREQAHGNSTWAPRLKDLNFIRGTPWLKTGDERSMQTHSKSVKIWFVLVELNA